MNFPIGLAQPTPSSSRFEQDTANQLRHVQTILDVLFTFGAATQRELAIFAWAAGGQAGSAEPG